MRAEAELNLNSAGFIAGAQKASRASDDMARAMYAGAQKIKEGFDGMDGVSLKSARKVAGNLKAVEGALLAGADASTLLQIGLLKVADSFKLGFGGTVALGGIALAVNKIADARAESEKLGKAFKEALRPEAEHGFEGLDTAKARVKELQEVIEEGRKKRGLAGGIGDIVNNAATELSFGENSHLRKAWDKGDARIAWNEDTDTAGDRDTAATQAQFRLLDYYRQIAKVQGEVNTLKARGFAEGEKAVKVAELELEKAEELAAIENGLGIPKLREKVRGAGSDESKRSPLQHDMETRLAAFDQQSAELDRKYELKGRAATLDVSRDRITRAGALRDVDIDRPDVVLDRANNGGKDVNYAVPAGLADAKEIRRLQSALKDARDRRQATREARGNTDADDVAVDKADAALRVKTDALRDQQKVARENTFIVQMELQGREAEAAVLRSNLGFEQQIAEARRAGLPVLAEQLSRQQQITEAKLRANQADERDRSDLRGRLVKVNRPDLPADSNRDDLGNDVAKVKSVARLREELFEMEGELNRRASEPGADTHDLKNAILEKRAALADERDAVRERNASGRANLAIQKSEMAGQTTLAGLARDSLATELAITEAKRQGNAATEATARAQGQLNFVKARLASTPEQRERERRAGLDYAKATQYGGLTNIQRDIDGNPEKGLDPLTNKYVPVTTADILFGADTAKAARKPTFAREAAGNTRALPIRRTSNVAEEMRPSVSPRPEKDDTANKLISKMDTLIDTLNTVGGKLAVAS